MNKKPMPEADRYRNKGIQSGTGMLRYRTEMLDNGIPMPAALDSMPMPRYDNHIYYFSKLNDFFGCLITEKIKD
jgi:hypothetical protein